MLYKDIDPSFRKLSTGGISEKEGTAAIIQFIQDILLTEEGESLFKPSYFTNISDYLEGTASIFSSLSLKREIYSALNNHLKNVIIREDDIIVTPNYVDNAYDIHISYRESDVEEQKDIEFSLNLSR